MGSQSRQSRLEHTIRESYVQEFPWLPTHVSFDTFCAELAHVALLRLDIMNGHRVNLALFYLHSQAVARLREELLLPRSGLPVWEH